MSHDKQETAQPETKQPEIPAEPKKKRRPKEENPPRSRVIEVLDASEGAPAEQVPVPQHKTRTRDAIVGLMLVILSCFGVWFLAEKAVAAIRANASPENEYADLEQCILPFAVMDMPLYESADELTDEQFLTLAAFSLIMDGKLSADDESDLCTVPADDLIAAGNARLHTEREVKCKSVAFSQSIRFYYDAEQKAFLIPAEPALFSYAPELISVTKGETTGLYAADVAYRADRPAWEQGEAPVVKTLRYLADREGDQWYITAIREID